MYPQQDPSVRNKKRLIVIAIGVFLSIIAIIVVSLSGSKSAQKQTVNSLVSYNGDSFSVSYPKDFTVTPTKGGQTFTGQKDKDGNQESFTITRYAPISSTINLETIADLSTKNANGGNISGSKTSTLKISNREALSVDLGGTSRIVYIASSEYIWSVRFTMNKNKSLLKENASEILNSFTPKEDSPE